MHSTREIKRIFAGLTAALLLSALSVPAFADEGHAVGNFQTEGGGTQEQEQLIMLSDGSFYSPDTDLFYRKVGSGSFGMNVPDGAITTGTVSASLAPAMTGTLYRNGVEMVGADLSAITKPGKYVLAVSANDAAQTVRVTFTIAASPTGSIKEYTLPADFYVVSATLNGEPANYSRSYVDMTSDGDYEISYRSPKANKDFHLSVAIDHTPPTAELSGITDRKANGPVTVGGVEDGAKIYLDRNGKQTDYTGVIDQTGSYVLTVQDEAGNETNYEFTVVTYSNRGWKFFIVMGAVLILALAGGFVYYRKYMRVS